MGEGGAIAWGGGGGGGGGGGPRPPGPPPPAAYEAGNEYLLFTSLAVPIFSFG